MTDRSDLSGRIALVTGAARGIGRACAAGLAARGAHVVVSDVNGEAAEKTAHELAQAGLSAEAQVLDVGSEATILAAFERLSARHGRLDVLVSNAGTGARMPAETLPLEDWRRVIDVNLTGGFLVAREAAKLMLDRNAGAMVFVSSIMGLVGGGLYPNAAYQASKGAIVNLVRTLALEWAARGIRVNAVAPTFARTQLTEGLLADPAMAEAILNATPMGRLAEPEEVADAVVFLASDTASMITGVTLPVDGGWVAR